MTLRRLVALSSLVAVCACKPKPGGNTDVKDFAYQADAKTGAGGSANVLVFAAHKPADPDGAQTDGSRWFNMATGGELGRFTVALNDPAATYTALKGAFAAAAPQLTEASTVVFAYTGSRVGNQLLAVEGTGTKSFTLADVMAPLVAQGKQLGRLYVFADATGSGATGGWLLDDASAEPLKKAFKQVVEFRAASGNVNSSVGYKGRLSTAFTTTLAEKTGDYRRSKASNPTLRAFFDRVRTHGGGIEYRAAPDAILGETVFNDATFPPPAAGRIERFDELALTPLPEYGGPTTVGALKQNKEHVFLEISSSWCGPCAQKALRVAADPEAQAIFEGGCGKMITVIVNDGEGAGGVKTAASQLATWKAQLDDPAKKPTGATKELGELVRIAMSHSLWTEKTGAELNGVDRNGNALPPGYLPASLKVDTYPKFMVVSAATGEVAVAGTAGDVEAPLAALKKACAK